ncbi:MAG: MGMT family protein [Anaerolineaceae bacterium]|nr:MGMT family protein [Anaerolineaceae bacterium]
MPQQSFLEKLKHAPGSSFHVLDPVKAKRMKAKTLFIPSPEDVAKVISAIPQGETRTIVELRRELAAGGNAETACPAETIKYWKWLASAYAEVEGSGSIYEVPWWRVLKDGRLSRHMPGGIEGQAAFLRKEGVQVK